MPQHIVKQPNGKYAIFSSVVDDFVGYDATPDEVCEHFRELAIAESDRRTKSGIEQADHFGIERFQNDINTVRVIHGDAKAEECLKLFGGVSESTELAIAIVPEGSD